MKLKMSDFLSPLSDDPPERRFKKFKFEHGNSVCHKPSGYEGVVTWMIESGIATDLHGDNGGSFGGHCETPLYEINIVGLGYRWLREEDLELCL